MFYTYIYYSLSDKRFYIGYTNNIERRVCEHGRGKVVSTSKRNDLKLIFYEAYFSEKDARRREKYFKTTKGKKGLRQMLSESLKEINKK
ncbi:GIY-YIG nuclease family protein [Patescibacteria group bacterium]|nr:GIY-YIG nuclease family protein [Patescibacteria group bacterium]MBU2633078.1 GIY-YIG nuclease family protein [Patescibacteria group bacterium]